MKNGTYQVSFNVTLQGCETEEDAHKCIIALLVDSIEGETIFPEVNFELVEEDELDYTLEEDDGVSELEFEETA